MTKTIHSLQQGSDAWHQFRLEHFGASEAAAMLGLSSKVKRTELLHMKHTGTAKEFSDWVQKNILDYGHEVEALARPIIEEEFGIDLYPVTCSLGRYSASCDGLTLCETIAFEHKQWNEELGASVREEILPEEYMPQCQQVLMVTGAEKLIFVVSSGTRERMVSMAVFPDPVWFDRIRAGWDQFDKDLAEYVPVVHPEKPEAEAIMQLPSLSIQTSGQISIISNLDLFGQKLNEFVGSLDLEPTDDQGFANAEAAVKTLQKAQDALEAAEASALAQAADVDEMRRTVALYADTARKTRLMLEKMVKARKEQIKGEIIANAKEAFYEHVFGLGVEIRPVPLIVQQPDLIGAAKNKRTLASLHDAVDTALANAKIAADSIAKDVRAKLAWHGEYAKGYELLFADLQQIIYKPEDDFQLLVKNRIDQHKMDEAKKLEAERVRIQAEEKQKAEANERIRAAEEQAKLQAKAFAEDQAKLAAERAAKPAETKPTEPAKPTLVKSESPAERVYPLMLDLATRDSEAFRKKYAGIRETAGIIREMDLFIASQQAAEARRA